MENKRLLDFIKENAWNADVISPKLYLCATPIGNLGDITLRTLETLRACTRIYCEDTRNTLKLLNAYGIKKPLESCHEHNEKSRAEQIAAEVSAGDAVVFVSDAGMPGVSDPGSALISRFIELGLPFEIQPGASAMTAAWVMSGLDTTGLTFLGFLPRSGAERTRALDRLAACETTCAIYESPLRVGATLFELACAIERAKMDPQSRPCALVRELTKTFEECVRGSVKELAERFESEAPRGECVLLIGSAERIDDANFAEVDGLLASLLGEGLSVKSAARIAAETFDCPKNAAYKRAMELKNE